MFEHILVPIHRDGWKFVAVFAAAAAILMAIWVPLGWIGILATLWCVYFFRDPARVTPIRPGLVISPADGLVVAVGPATPPADLEMGDVPLTRIGIFLNLLDVHINRVPMTGTIERVRYHKGQFLNASLDKASDLNERMAIRMTAATGGDIAFVQVAGLVARRIVCHLVPGQIVESGERFGLIRFGSRADIYVPSGWGVQVIEGQRVIGGETVLADAGSQEPARLGAVR